MTDIRSDLLESIALGALLLVIAAAIAFFNPVPLWSYFVAALLTLGTLLFVGVHVWAWRKHVANCRQRGQEATAMRWVRSGSTAKEVQDRYAEAMAAGFLMSSASSSGPPEIWFPAMNVDGTPMLPGTSVDMNGNVFGVSSARDDFSAILSDGALMHMTDAYSSPLGADDSHRI